MLNNKLLKNKNGQASESLTWIIVTVVLIFILIVFIYASVVLSKVKLIKSNPKEASGSSVDWIDSKTQMAYSISSNNKNRIQTWISEERKDE